MNRLLLTLIICIASLSAIAAEPPPRPQHNFLFIVDSSVSMEQRKPAAIKLVRDVIASRFDGQIEAGDSIDIWTYDTENNLRGFPPQIWQAENAQRISDAATQYLQDYRFKGKSEFANVASDLSILVPQTKSLLIVIITDGEQPFSGISLDLEINGYLAKKGKLNPTGTDPLLISLAAINGGIRTWTAYFGKGELALASLPGRKPVAKHVAETKSVVPPAAKPVSKAPVLHDATTPEAYSTFNYPPGTRITPLQPAAAPEVKRRDLPLALLASNEWMRAQKTLLAKATEQSAAAVTDKIANVASPSTNSAINTAQTNLAKSPATNATPLAATTKDAEKKTNVVAIASAKPSIREESDTKKNPTQRTITPAAATTVSSSAANLSSHGTLRHGLYISGVTGFSCVLIGSFLLYRKFRRPTQSIISRSLLQR
jgi:hypothetical protein